MNGQNKVLCISENLYVLHETIAALQESGYQTICAGSLDRAIALAEDKNIGAIVISESVQLVDPSPYVLLKSVRPDVPLLLLTERSKSSAVCPAGIDSLCKARDVREHFKKHFASTESSH